MTRKRNGQRFRRALKWERWPADALRHTAASQLYALHGDAGKVAKALGNSPGVLARHYVNLVSPDVKEAMKLWRRMRGTAASCHPAELR